MSWCGRLACSAIGRLGRLTGRKVRGNGTDGAAVDHADQQVDKFIRRHVPTQPIHDRDRVFREEKRNPDLLARGLWHSPSVRSRPKKIKEARTGNPST